MPLSVRLALDLPAKVAVCDSADVGALDGLALSEVEVGRASFAFCCLCRLMRSLVLILEGVRAVLLHAGEAEIGAAPPTGGDGNTFEPTEKPLLRRAIVAGSENLLLLNTGLVMGCNRTASCDVVCSGNAVDFRAESLILTTEEVREMLCGSDVGGLGFAAAACDTAGIFGRAE